MTDPKILDDLELTKRGSARYGVLLRQAADSLIRDARRLRKIEQAARGLLGVFDDNQCEARESGCRECRDAEQGAMSTLRKALEDCGAGED